MQSFGKSASEIGVRHWIWGCGIQRAADGALEGENIDSDQIVKMDPRNPLVAIAETAADAEAKRRQHFL